MSVAIAAELSMKREELYILVDALVRPTKVQLDDGGEAEVHPLLVAVQDARTAVTEPRVRSAAPKHLMTPLRLSALELLHFVDLTVGGRGAASRLSRVRSWSVRMVGSGSLDTVTEACAHANWWALAARALLEPSRTLPLRGSACPECGHTHVLVDGHGEEVVQPALRVDVRTGVTACWAADCGAIWAADALEGLADQLRRQTGAEHLGLGVDG